MLKKNFELITFRPSGILKETNLVFTQQLIAMLKIVAKALKFWILFLIKYNCYINTIKVLNNRIKWKKNCQVWR